MGANQSDLSNARYGYDMVVAVTQESINGTMKEYLSGGSSPEVIMYYVMDSSGNPKSISKADLLKATGGVDPLSIPASTPLTDPRLKAVSKAFFWYGFKAKIGLPPGYAPITPNGPALPNVVTLTASKGMVNYNLMCSEFQVVEASYGPRGIVAWLNESQPNGKGWFFNAKIPISQVEVSDDSNLPTDVKNAANALPAGTFSVQQLLLELDKAILNNPPKIEGVKPGTPLYTALNEIFLGAYFAQMKASGQPVLNYSIHQASAPAGSISVADLELSINPILGANGQPISNPTPAQQNLDTLCYLCTTPGHPLPPATQFTWNWVDESEAATTAGTMAIKKSVFVDHLQKQLAAVGAGPALCKIPQPNIHVNEDLTGGSLNLTFVPAPNNKFPLSERSYQVPTVDGPVVLSLGWAASGKDESHGYLGAKLGEFKVKYYITSSITLSTNKITLTNHFVMHADLSVLHFATADGNWVDVEITTDYLMGVDASGGLSITQQPSVIGKNKGNTGENLIIKLMHFFDSDITLKHIINTFNNWAAGLSQQSIDSLSAALNGSRKWVFPGGKTFSFESTGFSDSQDLVANLLYNSTH